MSTIHPSYHSQAHPQDTQIPTHHHAPNQSKRVCRDSRESFSQVAQLYKQPIINQYSNYQRTYAPTGSQTIIQTGNYMQSSVNSSVNSCVSIPVQTPSIVQLSNQADIQSRLKCVPSTHEPSPCKYEEEYSRPASFLVDSPIDQSIDEPSMDGYDSEPESFLDSADESSDEESKADQPIDHQSINHPLTVPHSWSDIVQKEHQLNHSTTTQSISQSLNQSIPQPSTRVRSPRTPSGRRTKRGRRTVNQSTNYSPAALHWIHTYQSTHQSAHIAHQKHVDRATRCHHDASCQRDRLIGVLSCVLDQLFPLRGTDVLPEDVRSITVFHTERVPSIPISAYCMRLAQYTEVSSEVLIHTLIHLNRLMHTRPNFVINSLNIHRLWLTSLLCSAKFFDDIYYNNAYFAKVGGIPNKELNDLEIEFLALINFDLFVDYNVYVSFYEELCAGKLHTECSCQLEHMPAVNPAYYAPPTEVEDEQHANLVDLSTLNESDIDSMDSVSVSSSRRSSFVDAVDSRSNHPLNARMRKERRKRAATSYSPATTASTNSFCSGDSGVSSSEDEDDDSCEDGDDTLDGPKLVDSGLLSKQVSGASTVSTLSVAAAIDNLQVHNKPVQMTDSPTCTSARNALHHVANQSIDSSFSSPLPFHPYTHALLFAPPPTSHPTRHYEVPSQLQAIV